MNQEFERFRKFIKNLNMCDGTRFDSSEGDELKELCYRHSRNNTSDKTGEENIIAVHLYHDELGWGRWEDESKAREGRPIEVKRIEELLRKASGSRFKKILFDSFIQYAQRTHQLVDEGVIDRVIFTEESQGIPLNYLDLDAFSQSKVNYVGGVYGYQCVRTAIYELRKYVPFFSVRPIKDAILFNEPSFIDKIMAMTSEGIVIEGHENPSFYMGDKIYSLFLGVRSERLLK